MNSAKNGTLIHAAVLGISVITALAVWTREKEPKALAQGDVVVWSGRAGDLEKISYESKSKKVTVEARKDAQGRYFVGTLEREAAAPAGDAGAPPPVLANKPAPVGFVSVGPGDKLAEALAPLKALRALGKIGDDRAAEFGLKEPEATIVVRLGGAEKKLTVGGSTPGGGDKYVRVADTGEVYVLKGEPIRNLESPDSLLIERDLHEWKDNEVARARVEAGGKNREIVRGGPEGKRFWADAGTPETNDETLGNWMSKLDRLRPTEFVLEGPAGKETVLRVEYAGKKPIGEIELVKVPGGEKPAYYVRTERTRLYGKVVGTVAEQLEQDLGTIVK
jgi:hypothetical protein